MRAIELHFPGGRYHATPWDAHVNEGAVEWPPSPWRILRALIATRHLKAQEQVPEDILRSLVDALSVELPCYALPSGTTGFHTRHYMPLFADKTTKVFDTFLHLPADARIFVAWPGTTLDDELASALSCLVDRLGYLGRAEAWAEGKFHDVGPVAFNCEAAATRDTAGAGPETDPLAAADDSDVRTEDARRCNEGRERVRVLAPLPHSDLLRWRAAALDERITRALEEKRRRAGEKGKPAQSVKLSPKEMAAQQAALPVSVYDALTLDTDIMRKQGWNRPPGSRWVEYLRPRLDARNRTRVLSAARHLPTVARFALAGQVLPRLTDTVFEAEKIRVALLAHSEGAPVFMGRDPATGEVLSGHSHAFILPEANGRHGHVTHVTLYARMGFDDVARAALERLRTVWQRSGHDLQLVLLGVGQPEDFAGTRTDAGQCSLLATSHTWVSRTPFVPTRHDKRKHNGQPRLDEHGLPIGSPEHDAIRLLVEQGFPRPVSIDQIPETVLGGKPTRWLAFRTERRKGHGRRAGIHGVGFRVTFPVPVQGPVSIGYGAHFGLGCFLPGESIRSGAEA